MELILALKGVAAEILETMPASCRNSYNDIMVFAIEVEGLVQLTNKGENHPSIDNFKAEAFVNCLKPAVCSTQKSTFAETTAGDRLYDF